MDLNLIKSKLGAMQQKSGGGSKKDLSQVIWKPVPGKHSVRIVPSAYNKSNPFKEMFFHYGIGTRTMISLVNFGEKDPIVEFAEQLRKSSDKDNWNMAKKLSPKMRVFVPVVVRGEEDKGVRLWEFGKQIYMELLAIAEDEDVGDYTDPMEGRDITIETTDAASNGTGYNQSKVRVRTKLTPLSTDSKEVEMWLTTQPDVMSLFKKHGYEEMKTALLEWLNPGEETPAVEEETTAPAATPVEAKPLTPAPGYSLNAKPKVDVDKAFDDLFSDDVPF
jgi:hypothetical protein